MVPSALPPSGGNAAGPSRTVHPDNDPARGALTVSERTLVLIKPDGVERHLVGEILARIERKGLSLAALELRTVELAVAEEHYAEHKGKGFYQSLLDFITGGPLVAAVFEGPNAVQAARQVIGSTNPLEAATGSIRGDFAIEVGTNMVHGSDSPESGAREAALFFPNL